MKKRNKTNIAIIRGISVALIFILFAAVIVTAIFLYYTRGEFVRVASGEIRLDYRFYIWTLLVIIISSALFTPFSFGISNYFINAKKENAKFSQIFYLFRAPRFMVKCIAMYTLRRVMITLLRLGVLILALVCECGVFVISVILSGENIFDYENNFLSSVAEFVTTNEFFIILTVIEWGIVIVTFAAIAIRYALCKYALIRFTELGAFEAVKIGVYSARGNISKIFYYYIKYISVYIFTFLTLGFSTHSANSFSTEAVRMVEKGREAYYLNKY